MKGMKLRGLGLQYDAFYRFASKIRFESSGCWIWQGYVSRKGYGHFSVGNPHRYIAAHRFAYILAKGRIPPQLQIDHVCRNRACVNSVHLDLVTNRENQARGTTPTSVRMRQTHCHRGHAFDLFNTYIETNGHRRCRICKRAKESARRYRLRSSSLVEST